MKKVTLLLASILTCVAAVNAQLATKVTAANNYGALFSDSTNLYALKADTIYSVAPATGALTFLYKLPAPPPGNYYAQWGTSIVAKTPLGFIVNQSLINLGAGNAVTQRIWANTGSGWDTLTTGTTGIINTSFFRLGNKYALTVLAGGTNQQLLRTDFTKAGTNVVLTGSGGAVGQITYDFKRGTDRIYFSTYNGSIVTGAAKEYYLDDASLVAIDSSSSVCQTLAAIGNDVYYQHRQNTALPTDNKLKKWSAGASAVLIPSMPFGAVMADGFVLNGRIVVAKTDSLAHHNRNIVSIDPASGAQTYLTNNPPAAYFPIYDFSAVGVGTAHAYIFATDSPSLSYEMVTDGLSASATVRTSNIGLYFSASLGVNDNVAAMCGDDAYGRGTPSGTVNYQLYRINGAGTVSNQVLGAGISTGANPVSYAHVGNEIFFRALGTAGNYDLWKISGCAGAVPNAVSGTAAANTDAGVYPNPASDRIAVRLDKGLRGAQLRLYDATGRTALAAGVVDGASRSVAILPAGLYLYRISTAEGALLGAGRISITH